MTMIREEQPARACRRELSEEERLLWDSVTRSVAPLRRKPRPPAPAVQDDAAGADALAGAGAGKAGRSLLKSAGPGGKAAPPPLAPLGRRLRQRLARGRAELDARIDLHGLTQERAHRALLRFLRGAQADGAKLVLVITGKGSRAAQEHPVQERGVLRRLVPQWLSLPEFRAYVVGFEPAHVAHGGDGALYVQVRRAR
ncbi:MAG: Smr/MutS family protein [Variibacter sp.]|nr:Smr/MutS family protein [Variibacter sp.]